MKMSKWVAAVAVFLVVTAQSVSAATATKVFSGTKNKYESTKTFSGSGSRVNDSFNFTLLGASTLTATVFSSLYQKPDFGITSLTLSLFSVTGAGATSLLLAPAQTYRIDTGFGSVDFNLAGLKQTLDAGSFSARVTGTTLSDGGSYRLSMAIAPVPEPHEWALMLGGLLVLVWRLHGNSHENKMGMT